MLKLLRLVIKNFQSHTNTIIDFDPLLNAFWGESDIGKTSVFRAVNWLINNEADDDFITWGEDHAEVAGYFSNGVKVTRERNRSGTINLYHLQLHGQEEVPLRGFGRGVPFQVREALGMGKVFYDIDHEDSLNFAYQLDAPFMIKEYPSVRGKAIGRLVGAHKTDTALKNTKTDITRSKSKQKEIKETIKTYKAKLEADYQGLEDEIESINEAERLLEIYELKSREKKEVEQSLNAIGRIRQEKERLQAVIAQEPKIKQGEKVVDLMREIMSEHLVVSDALDNLGDIQKRKEKVLAIIKRNDGIEQAYGYIDQLEQLSDDFKLINESLSQIYRIRRDKDKIQDVIAKGEKIDKGQKIVDQLTIVVKSFYELRDTVNNYAAIHERVVKGQKYVGTKQGEINQLVIDYQNGIKELGKCPICFGSVDDHTANRIAKELGA